jgi:hypothetical protein
MRGGDRLDGHRHEAPRLSVSHRAHCVWVRWRVWPNQLVAGVQTGFLQGDQWAHVAGIIAVLLGAALVFFKFPKRDEEKRLLIEYHACDTLAGARRCRLVNALSC